MNNKENNETARRAYWTEQMEQGYAMVEKLIAFPVQECGERFAFEFWHYDKDDAAMHIVTGNPAPCRFGPVNWDPTTNEVTPVADPLALLNPLSVIEREIAAALQRANLETVNP